MLKNILYSLFTKGLVALINFTVFIFSSRYLGISSRGEISIFLLNIAVVQVIAEIYTGYSIIHLVRQYDLKKIIVSGVIFTLVFCSLGNGILVLLNKHLEGFALLAYAICLLVLLHTFFCVLILANENIKLYSILSFIQPLFLLGGLLIAVFFVHDYTLSAYVYPLLISFALAIFISAFFVFKSCRADKKNKPFRLKPILLQGLIYQVGLLLFIFVNKYSYYLLLESSKVGLYASACSLMDSVLIISGGIGPVLLSKIANTAERGKVQQLTITFSKLSFVLSLAMVALFIFIPQNYILTILGSGFNGIKHVMLLYAPAVLFMSFFLTISNYFNGMGKQKIVMQAYGLGAICTFLVAPTLVKLFGVSGAAYTAVLSCGIIAVVLSISFIRFEKLSFRSLITPKRDFAFLREFFSR